VDDRITTLEPQVTPENPPRRTGPARRLRLVWWVLGPLLVLVATFTTIAAVVHAPYVMFAPGSAVSSEPLISVPEGQSYETRGDVLFTTVSVIRPTYLEAIKGWLQGNVDVFPRRQFFGDQSDDERKAENVQSMDISKLVAAKVAFEHLGYEVESDGVTVVPAGPDSPSAGILQAGDVVVALDGEPVKTPEELSESVKSHEPGDTLEITVERTDPAKPDAAPKRRDVEVELGRREGTGEAVIGVYVAPRYDFPVDVRIDSLDVGGPSAGLAWTLGVRDRLTPGSITGGERVAVTGEIGPDGQVLQVGGVGQKAVAAREEGATLFLVPRAEAKRARPYAGSMKVVGVDDLDDALRALDRIGGNALDLQPPEG
jgi:Lon-like protease